MECFIALFGVLIAVAALFIAKTRDIGNEGRALYLATFIAEFASIPARMFVGAIFAPFVLFIPAIPLFIVGAVIYAITQNMIVVWVTGIALATVAFLYFFVIGVYPHVRSLLYVLGMTGGVGWIMRKLMRARRLSEREMVKYLASLSLLQLNAKVKLRAPTAVYVIPGDIPYIEVIGTEVYITKTLLHDNDRHLTACLAIALGYVNSADGRLVLALRRFTSLPFYLISWAARETAPGQLIFTAGAPGGLGGMIATMLLYGVLTLAGGGIGSFMLSPIHAEYWKRAHRRHALYGANLGQRQAIINYIEEFQVYRVPVPFFSPEEDGELLIDELLKTKPITTRLVPQQQP
jgi:hypothetical protein